jgi:hypothetical protein
MHRSNIPGSEGRLCDRGIGEKIMKIWTTLKKFLFRDVFQKNSPGSPQAM